MPCLRPDDDAERPDPLAAGRRFQFVRKRTAVNPTLHGHAQQVRTSLFGRGHQGPTPYSQGGGDSQGAVFWTDSTFRPISDGCPSAPPDDAAAARALAVARVELIGMSIVVVALATAHL